MVKTLKSFLSKFLSKNFTIVHSLVLFIIFLSSFGFANATNITLSPNSADYTIGKTYTVEVKVSNNQDDINGVSGSLSFPSNLLQVTSISKTGSIINTWAEEPIFSNTEGAVSFEGVILNPGFSAQSGKIITIFFKAKASGVANISFKSGSVLANDGNATNVLGTLGSASFSISQPLLTETTSSLKITTTLSEAPIITSSTYPNQNKWYSSRKASFAWEVPLDVVSVSTLYDEKENSVPTKFYTPPINNKSFTLDSDGTMYMHVQFKTKSGLGKIANYKFQVDTIPPQKLEANLPDGVLTYNPTPEVAVSAIDDLSGLDYITMSVDSKEPVVYSINSSGLYTLPEQSSGKHTVLITVYDRAGNKNEVSVDYAVQVIDPPMITSYNKRIELGSPLSVGGNTYPNREVEVTLTDKDDNIISEKVTSDENGVFVLKWSGELPIGVYELRARVTDANGIKSKFSDARAVSVVNSLLLRVSMFIMNWISIILIVIVSTAILAAIAWYSYFHFGRFTRNVKRNTEEAENTLRVNISAFRRDLNDFYNLLQETEKKRPLTSEEQSIKMMIKKRIDTAENEIARKLEPKEY